MIQLTCQTCSKTLEKPAGSTFSGKPIEQWWEEDCQSLCLACRHSPPEMGIARPVGRPQTLSGAGDNAIQRAGAQAGIPKAGTRRAAVLEAVTEAGQMGMTFDELAQRLGIGYSNIGPRVRELRRDGLIAEAPFTRQASSGAQQSVWTAAS